MYKLYITINIYLFQIAKKLMQITTILESRTDIGDSLSSAKDLLEELDDFELKRKVCCFIW